MIAVKKIYSEEVAKDLVQDLFVSIWLRRSTININTSLTFYLLKAIKYKVINYIESNIVKRNYINSLDKAIMDYDNSTSETIVCNDLEQFIESGINGLSPKVKVVFELSRKENLTVMEIAEKLNVSEQTVKNQISTAIRTLRLHLHNISISLVLLLLLN